MTLAGRRRKTSAFIDLHGRRIRFTVERRAHVFEHPEMRGLDEPIARTVAAPECVACSLTDPTVSLNYQYHRVTRVGSKYLCVVVDVAIMNLGS